MGLRSVSENDGTFSLAQVIWTRAACTSAAPLTVGETVTVLPLFGTSWCAKLTRVQVLVAGGNGSMWCAFCKERDGYLEHVFVRWLLLRIGPCNTIPGAPSIRQDIRVAGCFFEISLHCCSRAKN